MKTKELIDWLQRFDPESEVYVRKSGEDQTFNITNAYPSFETDGLTIKEITVITIKQS